MSWFIFGLALVLVLILLEAPLFLGIAGVTMLLLLHSDPDPAALQMILIEMNRLATIMAPGAVMFPILRQQQYGDAFSLGLLTTGGSLGLLFAPSLPIILYGVVAQIDIGTIFKSTLMPGFLLLFVLSAYVVGHGRQIAVRSRTSLRQLASALRAGFWEWLLLILIIVGVYGGFVTIAEVSAVDLIYVIVVACFIRREIHWYRQLPGIMIESAMLCGAIVVILGMALGLTGYLVDAQIPNRILAGLSAFTGNRWLFLAGLNLFLILVGCIMDIFSAIVIFLVNLEIGYSTPPVGMNLFIASLKFERSITTVYRASVPYLALLLLCLAMRPMCRGCPCGWWGSKPSKTAK